MGWGWASMEWQNRVGSVLVVRADGKDLSPHQCEVLCDFCESKMQPLFEESCRARTLTMRALKDVVLQQLKKDKFEEYFQEYRARQLNSDPSWATTKSPYLT